MKRCKYHQWTPIISRWYVSGYRCAGCGLVRADMTRKKR